MTPPILLARHLIREVRYSTLTYHTIRTWLPQEVTTFKLSSQLTTAQIMAKKESVLSSNPKKRLGLARLKRFTPRRIKTTSESHKREPSPVKPIHLRQPTRSVRRPARGNTSVRTNLISLHTSRLRGALPTTFKRTTSEKTPSSNKQSSQPILG